MGLTKAQANGLANTSVTAGTYGSATAIPSLAVDAQGRITGASTFAVATGDTVINSQSNAYTLVSGDAGKAVYITTGGITVPNSVFSAGEKVILINNSGTQQNITQGSGLTIYNNFDASTGTCSLPPRGFAELFFIDASTAYITGADPLPTYTASNSTNIVLSNVFGNSWSQNIPKIYIIPSGVTVGGTGSADSLTASPSMGGTLTINNSGTIIGYGGNGGSEGNGGTGSSNGNVRQGHDASSGTAGGNAINVQSANITINNLSGGQISGGGGAGGGGGGGGAGGFGLGWANGGQGGGGGQGAGYNQTQQNGQSGQSAQGNAGDGGNGGNGGALGVAGQGGQDGQVGRYSSGGQVSGSSGQGGGGGAAGKAIYSSNSSSWTNGTTSGTYHGSYT